MEVIGSGSTKVLVVPPYFERTIENLFRSMNRKFKSSITVYSLGVYSLPRLWNGRINFESVLDKCRDVIRRESITVLHADERTSCFLLAILQEEFPHLRGPSIESVFLCSHSLYTKRIVDSDNTTCLPYIVVSLKDDIYDTAQAILKMFGCPGSIEVCLQFGRYGGAVYRNRDELIQGLLVCKKMAENDQESFRELVEKYVNLKKYPLATEPLALVERLEDVNQVTDGNYWLRIDIDACVNNGKFILWGMTDYIKSPYRDKTSPHVFLGKQMPSEIILKPFRMQQLWERFQNDVKNLVAQGFNNAMVRGQYKVYDDGDIRLVAVSPALKPDGAELYIRHMGEHADTRVAAITVAQNSKKRMPSPVPTSTFAVTHILTTPLSGAFSRLVQYEKCVANKNVVLRYAPDERIEIQDDSEVVVQFGCICVTGNHFSECISKLKHIREEILLVPQLVCTEITEV